MQKSCDLFRNWPLPAVMMSMSVMRIMFGVRTQVRHFHIILEIPLLFCLCTISCLVLKIYVLLYFSSLLVFIALCCFIPLRLCWEYPDVDAVLSVTWLLSPLKILQRLRWNMISMYSVSLVPLRPNHYCQNNKNRAPTHHRKQKLNRHAPVILLYYFNDSTPWTAATLTKQHVA